VRFVFSFVRFVLKIARSQKPAAFSANSASIHGICVKWFICYKYPIISELNPEISR